MTVTEWPLAGRADLVRAFRPDADGADEAPFRTLRRNLLATGGAQIASYSAGRLVGRLSCFSSLNVDAARWARLGRRDVAAAFTRCAATVEQGRTFSRLTQRLATLATDQVAAVLDGRATRSDGTTWMLLVALARETDEARRQIHTDRPPFDVLRGVVEHADAVTVTVSHGESRTLVPTWMAHGAHRDAPGQVVVVVTERSGPDGALVRVVPGIDTDEQAADDGVDARDVATPRPGRFSPYGRSDHRKYRYTDDDLAVLQAPRAPFRVTVPVEIER